MTPRMNKKMQSCFDEYAIQIEFRGFFEALKTWIYYILANTVINFMKTNEIDPLIC